MIPNNTLFHGFLFEQREGVRGIQSTFISEVIFPPLQLAKGSFNSMLLALPWIWISIASAL
jgi:hypothetical protein